MAQSSHGHFALSIRNIRRKKRKLPPSACGQRQDGSRRQRSNSIYRHYLVMADIEKLTGLARNAAQGSKGPRVRIEQHFMTLRGVAASTKTRLAQSLREARILRQTPPIKRCSSLQPNLMRFATRKLDIANAALDEECGKQRRRHRRQRSGPALSRNAIDSQCCANASTWSSAVWPSIAPRALANRSGECLYRNPMANFGRWESLP